MKVRVFKGFGGVGCGIDTPLWGQERTFQRGFATVSPMRAHRRTIILLLAHYCAVAVVALAGFISNDMVPVACLLPMGLVPIEEALFWKHEQSSAERTDRLVFGACVIIFCAAFVIYGLGLTFAAWVLGGLSLTVWTVYGFWRALRAGGF